MGEADWSAGTRQGCVQISQRLWQLAGSVILAVSLATASSSSDGPVTIDLRYGVVKGYNSHISFLHTPRPGTNHTCSSQAVLRVSFPSPQSSLRVRVDYGDTPRLWSLHVSDSPAGDGFGGLDSSTSNNAELNIHNRQMRLYGNDLPASVDAAMNGGRLIKIYDNLVKKGSRLTLEISDQRFSWSRGRQSDVIQSPFLFALSGQRPVYGSRDEFIYLGLNRVVGGEHRTGSGLCGVEISLQLPPRHCDQGTHTCHKDADCVSTRKSFRCKCKTGYNGDGKVCKDADECALDNGGCAHACLNTPGNYSCSCKPGFVLAPDHKDCVDKNECFESKGGCSHQCVNTLGSFECRCNHGYSLDTSGKRCVYGQYCKTRHQCDHGCKTVGNKVECYCRDGYFLHGDGKRCLRSCLHGNGGCQHVCNQTVNGPVCSCAPRYILNADKQTCTASCTVNNGGCERKCEDTPTGPLCSCPPGYKLHQDGRSCLDVDECAHKLDGCSHRCENVRGGYECVCPSGYKVGMDDKTCIDIDECRLNTTCDHTCENSPGSYLCHCRQGFQKYGLTHCGDVDECAVRNGGCAHGCANSVGSYRCTCRPGYKLHSNKHECVESNQCTSLASTHTSVLSCTSTTSGGQQCQLQCPGRLWGPQGLLNISSLTTVCGRSTGYNWTRLDNGELPLCSETVRAPHVSRKARFVFVHETCDVSRGAVEEMRQNLTRILNNEKRYRCSKRCQINSLDLHCGSKRKKFRKLIRRNRKSLITAEFELQFNAKRTRDKCDVECYAKRTTNRLNRAFKKLKRAVRRHKLTLRLGDAEVKPIKKSFKYDRKSYTERCLQGLQLMNKSCVACPVGTFFSLESSRCEKCPRGTYQDREARTSCKECPDRKPGSGIEGATQVSQCSELCEPGTVSESGKKPCQACGRNSYQPLYGRVSCVACGGNLRTGGLGSTDFSQCLTPVVCPSGNFYNLSSASCQPCLKGWYQPRAGQDFCFRCPGKTSTDFTASTSQEDCKDRRCGRYVGDFFGVLESPNYPGEYPVDVECVWKIKPEKRRRILIIIPEIALSETDKCGDVIVMRKSKSLYSQNTFETCESRHRPIAFTARSKKLWIQFKSNGNHTASGFSIPFVTYNEEYESLIEDIVRDGRLYSSKQHQQIFKDRELLTALLEVIATPYNYLKYAYVSHTMFPESFFRLLTPKVRRFFQT